MARAKGFTRERVREFYDVYKSQMAKHKFKSERIFNLDETGITTVQSQGKILAPKGKKQVGAIASAERGSLVTMCNVISATGQALPPVFVFPRVNFREHMINGAPNGTLGLASKSGWMNAELFPPALTHFMNHMNVTKDNKALLIMDNHSSHVSLEVQQLAKGRGLEIITFPPHCSHKMQPLDVSVYGPFKRYYNNAATNWMLSHVGRTISIYDVAELAGVAFQKAMTIENITSGFRSTGIYPLNDDIFTDNAFLAGDYLSGENIEALPETENPSISDSLPNQSCVLALPKPAKPSNKVTGRKRARGAFHLTKTPTTKKSVATEETPQCAQPDLAPQGKRRRKSLFPKDIDVDSEDSQREATPSLTASDDSYTEEMEEEKDAEGLKIDVGQFVVVEYSGKRNKVGYVGQVLSKEDMLEWKVSFYRNKGNETFVKPENSDEAVVFEYQIVKVLPNPVVSTGSTLRNLTNQIRFPVKLGSLGLEIR